MSVIVAGTVRVPPESLEAFREHMTNMLAASRAEPGCLEYSYAVDVQDPGLVRVFEVWRDQADLEAHFRTPHMARWREAWPQFGVSDRRITTYSVASSAPI
jgi:quinol monooxygenase YgiN